MPRPRKRVDFAPATQSPGKMINDVGKAFRELSEIRGVLEGWRQAFQELSEIPDVLEGWRRRFPNDDDEAIVDKVTAQAVQRAVQHAVHDLVFGLSRATAHPPAEFRLAGRSADREKHRQALRDAMAAKIIKEPPANTRFISRDGVPYFIGLWQRLSPNDQRIIDAQIEAEIGSVVLKRGRPRSAEGRLIAAVCLSHFERITGRRATFTRSPKRKGPSFVNLVRAVFAAMGLQDGAEPCARAALRLSPTRCIFAPDYRLGTQHPRA